MTKKEIYDKLASVGDVSSSSECVDIEFEIEQKKMRVSALAYSLYSVRYIDLIEFHKNKLSSMFLSIEEATDIIYEYYVELKVKEALT